MIELDDNMRCFINALKCDIIGAIIANEINTEDELIELIDDMAANYAIELPKITYDNIFNTFKNILK